MSDRIITTDQGYTISYAGGRLADVIIGGVAVECVQVRRYDFATGEFGPEPSDEEIRESVSEFLSPEDMPNYRELSDFYRRNRA